jgi:hypothetical protein
VTHHPRRRPTAAARTRAAFAGFIVGLLLATAAAVGAAGTSFRWDETGRTSLAAPALIAQRAPWACTRPAEPATCARVTAGILEMVEALHVTQRPSAAVIASLSDVNVELGGDQLVTLLSPVVPTLAPGPTVARPVLYDLTPATSPPAPTTTAPKVQGGCIRSDTGGPC